MVKRLATVVIFDENPILYEKGKVYCYCKVAERGGFWFACSHCDAEYHSECVGLKEGDLQGVDYVCGYCLSAPDGDGNRKWNGELKPRPGQKQTPKPPVRNDAEHRARMERYAGGGGEIVGPRSWTGVEEIVAAVAKELRGEAEAKYQRAAARRKQGGRHITDMSAGNGLVAAPLTEELVDFLEGNDEI